LGLGFEGFNGLMGRFSARRQRGTGSAVWDKQPETLDTKEFQPFQKEITETPGLEAFHRFFP
jgi:hypothetical protein